MGRTRQEGQDLVPLLDPWGMILFVGEPARDPVLRRAGAAMLLRSGARKLGTTTDEVIETCTQAWASPYLVEVYSQLSAEARAET